MTTSCEEAQRLVWAGEADVPWLSSHVDSCTVCRLEIRRAGQLTAALSGMRAQLAEPPPGLRDSLISNLPAEELGRTVARAGVLARLRGRTPSLGSLPGPALERVSQGARRVAASPTFRVGAAMGAVAATAAFGLIVTRRLVRPADLLAAPPPGLG